MRDQITIYVGTGKLVGLIGSIEDGEARVHRFEARQNPAGFERGLVTDIERASASIQELVETLLPDTDLDDISCHVVLGNSKLSTYHFSSSQYYQGAQRTVSSYDIRSIISQTRSVATLPLSEIVLQAVPESFLVNDMVGIRNPLGLEAQRLGVELKIFTMSFQDFKNIHKVFEALDMEVLGYFPKTLTLSEAILDEQERSEGVLIFDIAEDVTHLVLWKNGYLIDTKAYEVGGGAMTQKIADRWQIEYHDARKAKEQYGAFETHANFGDEIIPLIERNGQGNLTVRRQDFEESFVQIGKEWLGQILQVGSEFASRHKVLYPHYIVTGGGTRIDGFIEFLQKEFSVTARLGLVRKMEAPNELAVDPSLVAGLGMYRWLATQELEHRKLVAPRGFVEKTLSSARNWFSAYF